MNSLGIFHHGPRLSQEDFKVVEPIYEELSHRQVAKPSKKATLKIAIKVLILSILRIMKVLRMDTGAQSYNFCLETNGLLEASNRLKLSLTDARPSSIKSLKKENEAELLNGKRQFCGPGIRLMVKR